MKNPHRAESKVNPQRTWRREIATSVFRALIMAGLTGGQYQVVFVVIERTWGFNRKSHPISWTEFAEWTHLDRRTIGRVIAQLQARRIIIVNRNSKGSQVSDYAFNKHWDTWKTDAPLKASIILKGSPGAESMTENGTDAEKGTHDTDVTGDTRATGDIGGTDQGHRLSVPVAQIVGTGDMPEPTPEPLKERKENRKKEDRKGKTRAQLFELWNSLNITQHSHLTDKRSVAITAALEHHTIEELCQAVINYAKVLHGEEYFWDYRWTLEAFLNEGLDRFIDAETAFSSHRVRQHSGQKSTANHRARSGGETEEDFGITPMMTAMGALAAKFRREHKRTPTGDELEQIREQAERQLEAKAEENDSA